MRMWSTCLTVWMAVGLLLPGLAQAQKAKTVEPFNGKDLTGWKTREPDKNEWVVGKAALNAGDPKELQVEAGGAELINAKGHGTDIYTEATFGDCLLEVEVMVPQESNSGVYLMGEYEVQVLDSYGKKEIGQGDMGSIYSAATALVNASKPAGEWQKFVIDFRAPKFGAEGKKTANATFVKVTLAVVLIPSSSGIPLAPPFLVALEFPFPAKSATCNRKHKALKPSIKTLH